MTNAELIAKIKAEIERLKSNMDDRDPLAPNQKAGYLFALADVLSFISTLESEKPVNLEEEISRTYHDGSVADTSDLDHNSYENIARHFAEWGAEHLVGVRKMIEPEKMEREEELKKAVHQVSEEIVKEIFPDDLESGDFFTEIDLKNCITRVAYQFADWGAEHLKK